ncbi:MAG: hypothetical protein A2W91_19080 [Bacteroidetes bacterium GWF2_38_335]|nr:MAG: hypothetical protein A2W91_19080 [Bacteroidetes bacterium GWF2_38_335]OFY80225.1 MAG: hypothetical protein A2281_17115 [Bacteroidetes bacterium RIFOXYA12_FULL_38_20]HBS88748.1 hypothetical protein [Bacteroidales bacterium]
MKYLFLHIAFLLLTVGNNISAQSGKLVHAWNYFNNDTLIYSPDTSLNDFQIYNPVLNSPVLPSYLGNLGLPALSNNIKSHLESSDFFLFKPYSLYFKKPENVVFYNTKRPLTRLKYTSGSKKEYLLNVFHSQNVNENLNLGLDYLLLNSVGQYLRQTTKNFGVTLFSEYHNHRYNLNAGIIINRISSQLNGGIQNNGFVTDSVDWNIAGIPVWLSGSSEKMVQNIIFMTHKLNFGKPVLIGVNDSVSKKTLDPKISLIYKFNFSSDYRNYYEEDADTIYYENIFYRYDKTFDSLHYKQISNSAGLQWKISSSNSGFFQTSAFIKNKTSEYFNSYFWYTASDTLYTANYAEFSFVKTVFEKYRFNSFFSHGLSGHGKGEMDYNLRFVKFFSKIKQNFLQINAGFKRIQPDFYENRYISNHFSWNNEFLKKDLTEISLLAKNTKFNLAGQVEYFILDNYIYFNNLARPAQCTSTLNVIAATIEKTFKTGKVFYKNVVKYQHSSDNSIISIPEIAFYNSTYWEKDWFFKATEGRLTSQLGFDLRINSEFYAKGYDAATGMFYSQTVDKIGNYPFIDVFLNVKLKRARFFFKLEHAGYGFFDKEYFLACHYPANIRAFRFGILWMFYD